MNELCVIVRDRKGDLHKVLVRIECPVEEIAEVLASKAFRNKTKKTHIMGGLIRLKIMKELPQ